MNIFKKNLPLVCFIVFSSVFLNSSDVFSQASFSQARHETPSQNQIDVTFNQAISFSGAPTTTGWTVTVNGTSVALSSIGTFGPTTVRITFNASSIVGHTPTQTYLLPSEVLRVSYNATGNLTSAGGVNTFSNQQSFNNTLFNCSELSFRQQGVWAGGPSVDNCVPVVMNFTQYQFNASLRWRNSSTYRLSSANGLTFNISWGDAVFQNVVPYESENNGTANAAYFEDSGFGGNPGIVLTARPTHTYPNSTTPAPDICSWDLFLRPIWAGAAPVSCNGLAQTTVFNNWDTDNRNSGTLNMPANTPGLGETTDRVCLGVNVNMRFSDQTLLNCRLAAPESNKPNQLTRYIRVVYGSTNYAAPGNIPDIRVGGVPVTTNVTGGGVLVAPFNSNPILGNTPGYVLTGAGGVGVPDFNGVIELATPVLTSTLTTFMQQITTVDPSNQAVGQRFYVRLDYWDVCNPYNPVTPDANRESVQNYVEIIGSPNAPTIGVGSPFCETAADGSFNVTATGTGSGALTYTWYKDAALAITLQAISADNTFNPVTEGPGADRITKTVAASTTYNRYVTVTQGSNNCTSPPATITIRIDDTNTPGVIAHPLGATPIIICSGTDPAAFTSTTNATGGGPAGTITYQWQSATNSGFTAGVTNIGTNSNVFDPSSITSNLFIRRNASSGACATVNSNVIEFRVDTPVTGGTINSVPTICESPGDPANITNATLPTGGSNAGTYTYQWQSSTTAATGPFTDIVGATGTSYNPPAGVIQTTFYRRRVTSGVCSSDANSDGIPDNVAFSNVVTVTVNNLINSGTISGAQIICSGQNPVAFTASVATGGNGTTYTYAWEQSTTSITGPFSSASGTNNLQTYDPPVLTQTTWYRRKTTSGACPSVDSNVIEVTVNPLPSAANPTGGGAVCGGNPAPDINWTLTGTPPFDITYTETPGGPVVVTGWPSTTFTISSPTPGVSTSYQITSLTDANGCSATSMGSTASVTIGGNAPAFDTAPTLTPDITCDAGGSTSDPVLNFSLTPASTAAGTYTLTYRINGGSNLTKSFSVNIGNGDPSLPISFNEASLNSVATHTIRIVSILTSTGCITTFNTDLSFTVRALPAITTQPTNSSICSLTNTSFTVAATGTNLSYQWQEKVGAGAFSNLSDGGVYSGSSTATLTLTAAPTAMSTNQYRVIVTGYNAPSLAPTCSVTSNAATLTVNAFATITTQPTNAVQCVGLNTSFTIASSGPGITRQWQISTNGGATFTDLTNTAPYSNVTTATLNITGVTAGLNNNQYRVRLTTTGSCTINSNAATLTVNPLPAALNPAPAFCEALAGGGSITGKLLTDHNDGVTGIVGSTDRTVVYFSDAGRTTNVTAIPQTITNGKTYFTRVTTVSTGCVTDGTIVFTINSLPTVVNQNLSFCEDVQGTNLHGPFDLTTNNLAIANGSLTNRSVAWFSDAGLTTSVPTPASFTLTGTTTLFARVTNTVSGCNNVATVTLTTKPRPAPNAIQGNASVCTGNTVILYQLDPSLNPGSTYTWTVSGTPAAAVQVFGGGGTNSSNFFVLLKFPSATGTADIDVFETLNGCTGVTNHLTVNVNSAPAANTINGVTQVCSGQSAVNFQVAAPNVTSTYTWTVSGATIASTAGPSLNVDFGVISPVTIQVTETSASGCVGSAATKNVIVNSRPSMTSSSTNTICSGVAPGLVFTSSIASTYSWIIPPGGITGSISGATVGQTGSGDLSATFTGVGALRNTSGAVGSITFNVTPTSSASGCTGTTQAVVLTVDPEPSLVAAQTKTICSGQAVNYEILTSPLNLPSGTSFTWTAPVMSDGSSQGTPGNVAAGAAGTPHILDVLTNTSASAITATYTITPVSGAGCPGTPRTVVITVNPQPIVSTSLDNTLCSDVAIGTTLTTAAGSVAANNWNITAISVSGALVASSGNAVIPATGVSSTYISNDNYTNTTNLAGTVTYTIVPVSASGCLGAAKIITITINPEPSLSASLDKTVCSDEVAGISLATTGASVAAVSYNIVGKTVAPGLIQGGSNAVIGAGAFGVASNYIANDSYTNTTNGALTVVYQVVPVSSLGCAGDPPKSVTLTIRPEPVVSSSLNASVCSGIVSGLTLNTNGISVAAANYSITSISIDPGLVAGGSNASIPAANVTSTYLTNDVYTNTTNSVLTVSYTVVPKSADNCVGDARIITITVNPEPVMSTTLDATVCSDLASGLILNTNGSSIGAASYNITARSISGGLVPNVANAAVPATGVAANYLAADVFTNTTALPLTVSYTVVPVSSSGCLGSSRVIILTINPEPVVSSTLNSSVCSSLPIGVTLNTNGLSVVAATYNITSISFPGLTPGGGNAVVPNNGVSASYISNDVYSNSGALPLTVTYTVVPVSAVGCLGDPRVITMTVNPEPIMSGSLNATVCSNIAVGLTLNTNGTSVGAASYNVVSISVPGGLTANGSNAVVANGVASNYLSNDRFTNTTAGPLVVTYSVVPVSAAGCPGPSRAILITINPEPVVSSSLDASICSDVVSGLTLATSGGSVGAVNYNITSRTIQGGLGAGVANATVPATSVAANYLAADVFTNTTSLPLSVTYTVVPVSADGCVGAAKVITLTINPEPIVLSTLNATVCSQQSIGLSLGTTGTSVAAASYNITAISIGAGLTAAGTNVVVPANGVAVNYLSLDKYTNTTSANATVTYTVVPVSASGCVGDPVVITMTIQPEPVVSTLLNATVCSDAAINLTLNTNGTSVAAANYNITGKSVDGGLIAAGTNVSVPATAVAANYLLNDRYNNVGLLPLNVTYTIVPVSAAGCLGATRNIVITINPEPVLSGTLNLTQCSDVATGLSLSTVASSVAAQNYNISLVSIAAGLTASGTNATLPATGVNANYLANDRFTNTTAGDLTVVYEIVPVSASGCLGNPVQVTVTIRPEPVVATTLNSTICSDQVIALSLNTNGTSVAAVSYEITSVSIAAGLVPDPANAVIPASARPAGYLSNDKYTNTGSLPLTVVYTVSGTSGAGCLGDSRTITITINPEPVVSTLLNTTVCSDANTGLNLATNGTSVSAATYNIVSRTIAPGLTPAVSNVAVPANGVASTYLSTDKFTNTGATPLTVTYTVAGVSGATCVGDTQSITITINPEPVVSGALNLTQCSDVATALMLNTNGLSIGAVNYNVTNRVIAAGLTPAGTNAIIPANGVSDAYLAADKFTNTGSINQTVVYTVVPVSAVGCLGDPINITVTIQPEPVVSTTLDKSVCSDLVTGLTLNTNGLSVAAVSYDVTAISIPVGITPALSNAVVPSVGGVTDGYLANDKFTNATGGSLSVSYTIVPTSADGCKGDPKIVTITVDPEPVVANGLDASICSDNSIGLTLNTNGISIPATTYNILTRTVTSGLTAAGTNVAVPANGVTANYLAGDKFTNLGSATLDVVYTLIPISGAGCEGDVKTITISIRPEPVIATNLNTSICSDNAIGLLLNTNGTSIVATGYNIVSRAVAGGLITNGANATVPAIGVADNYLSNDQYTNTTAGILNVTYVVVPVSADGCLGDSKSIVVSIKPEPVVATNLNATVCSGETTNLTLATNGSSIVAANYNITAINVAPGLIPDAGNATVSNGESASYLASDKFVNTGSSALAVTYSVVPVSADGCLGDLQLITIIIDPQPVVSTLLDATVCSNGSIGLNLTTNGTSVAATQYNILTRVVAPTLTANGSNVAVPANGVAANYLAADKFSNTTNSIATVVYTVVPISAAGCFGDQQSITITINPEPVVASGLNKTSCSDQPGGIVLNTNGTSVAAASYNIISVTIPSGVSAASVAVVPANAVPANYLLNDTYTNTGGIALDVEYTIVPVSAAGCLGAPLVVKQTVRPEPVVGALDKAACSDEFISLTLNTNGTSVSAANYNVTNVAIAPGLTAAGTNASIPGSLVAATYLFNDKYTNPGSTPLTVTYTIVPVSVSGCEGDAKLVVVTITPEPVVAVTLDRTVCSGLSSGIVLNTNGTSVVASAYNITSISADGGLTPDAGNVSIANGVAASYVANDKFTNTTSGSLAVRYTVVPVSADNCLGDPIIVTLTIDPQPVMDPSLANITICSRGIINKNLGTNGSSVVATMYDVSVVSQDFGLTGTPTVGTGLAAAAIFNDSFENVTAVPLKVTYQVVPRSAAGCYGAAFTITVIVNPEPVISPTLDNTVCSDEVSNIILSTNGTSANAASYKLVAVNVPGAITANPSNVSVNAVGGINLIRNDKYTNTSAIPVVVVYSIQGTSNAGCEGQVQLINLTINPKPVLDPALNPVPVCSGVASGVTLGVGPGSVAAVSYNVNSITSLNLTAGSSNTGIGSGKAANAIFNDVYVNTTSVPQVAVYKIVPVSAAGCLGAEATVTLTINPSPALLNNLSTTVCSTDASGITLGSESSSVAAANYNVISVTIQPGLTQTAGNAGARVGVASNELIGDRFENLTNGILTVTYRIEPVSAAGCKGPQVDVVLTVEPTVTMITPPNATICSDTPNSPSTTNILLESNTVPSSGVVTFNYFATSTPPGAVTGFTPVPLTGLTEFTVIADKLVNSTNSPATVTYTITPVAASAKGGLGCTAPTSTQVVITVEPKPKLSITPSTQTVCEAVPSAMQLTSTSAPSGGGTIQFDLISTVKSDPSLVLLSVPKISYVNNESVTDIWDNPTSLPQTVTYTFRARIIGGSGLGCTSEDLIAVLTVNPRPTIAATPANATICSSDFVNVTLSATDPNYDGFISTYTASDPSGKITGETNGAGNVIFQTLFYNSTTPTVANSDSPVTVTYTVTPRLNGCAGPDITIPVIVNPKPKINGPASTYKICHNNSLVIPLSSNVVGTNYTWTVENLNGLPGITDQTTPVPAASINQLLLNTTGVQASITYTIKAFGPGANPNDCEGDQKIVIVTVAPEMNATFQNTSASICKGSSEFLIIAIDGQAPFSFTYSEDDGTTNTDKVVNGAGNFKVIQVNPTVTTTYTIKSIKDAFNCPINITGQSVTITVGDTDPAFSVVETPSQCSPFQYHFQYNQKAGTQYTWQWQDGSSDSTYVATTDVANQIVPHTFANLNPNKNQDYNVTLRVELPAPFPGCFKFSTQKVTIKSIIITNVPDVQDVCSGETVSFRNQSLGVTSHRWFWRLKGDVSGTENEPKTTSTVDYAFMSNSSVLGYEDIEVVYRANNAGNCPAPEVIKPIRVYTKPTATFTNNPVPPFNSGSSTVTFTNTTTPVPINFTQFRHEWSFGITGDANPATLTQTTLGGIPVTYFSPGTKDISLGVVNTVAESANLTCRSDAFKTITVLLPDLDAFFDVYVRKFCFPGDIKIDTVRGTGFVHEWFVINKKTGVSSVYKVAKPGEFKISEPGTYTIRYKTSLPQTGQVKIYPPASDPALEVEVYDLPMASFDLRPDVVFVPDTQLETFNFSDGATGYRWNFGDTPDFVTDEEPKYTYAIEGKYDVTLIAENDHGGGVVCRDTLVRPVIAKQGGQSKIPNAFTPNTNGPSGGNGGSGTFNDVFLPIVKGVPADADAYNLQIFDRWGNLIFESNSSSFGWDGYNKDGKLMPAGVYVYKLTVRFSDSQRTTQVGDITMIY
ncbi:MAG: PKD-like domain-containing protein [Cyclobacteriaceae bacterium]|jgi:gliding motility-associated-like protein